MFLSLVTDFSKKTGDYRSLSAVDIRVLALVYELEKEHVGTQHVKELPDRNVCIMKFKSCGILVNIKNYNNSV